MSKQARLNEEYRKARHAYAQKRSYYKKQGITLPDLPAKPKRITEGSIRKLKEFSERAGSEARTEARKARYAKPKAPKAPGVIISPTTGKPIPTVWDIEYDNVIKMLQDIPGSMSSSQTFYNPGAGRSAKGKTLAWTNAQDLIDMLDKAKEKFGVKEVMERLHKIFPGRDLQHELERIAYALYDKEYSAWGGGEFSHIMTLIRSEFED